MTSFPSRPPAPFWLPALATLALGACGGGGSDAPAPPPPPPAPAAIVVSAAADDAALAWNQPAMVKVLANDTASRGALTVSAVTTPANGAVKIVGNEVEYTPKADHVGNDSFTYTAKAEDGVTATATVTLKVHAALTLKGIVTDGPIANAAVTATVGTQTFTATADAQGAYTLPLQTATPTDAILLSAVGTGAQAHVKLTAVLGDLASAYKAADKGVLAGTGITHYSTALAALVTEANAHQAPATAARLAELSRGVSAERLVDLATAIKLVVDKGVALPAGAADTAALVSKPGSSTLLKDFLAAQAAANATVWAATRSDVLGGDGVAGRAFAPTAATERFFYVAQLGANGATQVAFQPDGTGRLTTLTHSSTGRWAFDADRGDVVFTLDTPLSVTGYTSDLDPVTRLQNQIRFDTDVYRFKQVAGDAGSGAVLLQARTRSEILDGSRRGQTETRWGNGTSQFTTPALMPAFFKTLDFVTGMQIAGVAPLADIGLPAGSGSGADILEVTGAGTARLLRSGETVGWRVSDDGSFILSRGDLERRYQDLGLPDAHGLLKWLAVRNFKAGALVTVEVLPGAGVDGGNSFRSLLVTKRWSAQLGRVVSGGVGTGLDYSFQPSGNGQRHTVDLVGGGETAQNLTWTADLARRSLVIRLLNSAGSVSQQREWLEINSDATGSCFSVLEQLRSAAGSPTGAWRINVLTHGATCTAGGSTPATPAALGTLVSATGDKYALRVNLRLDAAGQVTGGDYDFHTTLGTLTPCTATPANTGPTGTCMGTNGSISTSSQGGAIPRSGTTAPITLSIGPDSWGYAFSGTLTGKVWSGTFTKASTTTAPFTDSGSFSVEVGIP